MGIVGATPFSCKPEEKTMSYLLKTIHVDQDVEVELDVQDLLEEMDTQDIVCFVRDQVDMDDILGGLDTTEVLNSLPFDDVIDYVVDRRANLAALLRVIAGKLENQ
jgi:hypothetical protein